MFAFTSSVTMVLAPIGHTKTCTVLLLHQLSEKINRETACFPGGVTPIRCSAVTLEPFDQFCIWSLPSWREVDSEDNQRALNQRALEDA